MYAKASKDYPCCAPERFRERHAELGYVKALAQGDHFPACSTCATAMDLKVPIAQMSFDLGCISSEIANLTMIEKHCTALRHIFGRVIQLTPKTSDAVKYVSNTAFFSQKLHPHKRTAPCGRLLYPNNPNLAQQVIVICSGPGRGATLNGDPATHILRADIERIRTAFRYFSASNPRQFRPYVFDDNFVVDVSSCRGQTTQSNAESVPPIADGSSAESLAPPCVEPEADTYISVPQPRDTSGVEQASFVIDNLRLQQEMNDLVLREPDMSDPATTPTQFDQVATEQSASDLPEAQFNENVVERLGNTSDPVANQSDGMTPAEIPVYELSRARQILSEFDHGENIALAEAFPWIFPIGCPEIRRRDTFYRHLLYYWDHRFENERMLIFYLFNKGNRHKYTQNVARIPENEAHQFAEKLTDAAFIDDLENGLNKTKYGATLSKEEAHAMAYVQTVLKITQRSTPFSTSDAKANQLLLHSMFRTFDLPMFFVTFSPNPGEQDLGINMCVNAPGFTSSFALPYPTRMERVYSRPASAARFFNLLVDAFIADILGFTNKSTKAMNKNKDGIFGKCSAYHLTVECQSRSLLHAHVLVWGGLSPSEVTELIRRGMSGSWKALMERLVTTELPVSLFNKLATLKESKKCVPSPGMTYQVEGCETMAEMIKLIKAAFPHATDPEIFAAAVLMRHQHHDHSFTCMKTTGPQFGTFCRRVCRMAFSRPESDATTMYELLTVCEFKTLSPQEAALFEKRGDVYVRELSAEEEKEVYPCALHSACGCTDPFYREKNLQVATYIQKRARCPDQLGNFKNANLAETNLTLAACMCCNTNVSILQSAEAAAAATYYVVGYLCKCDGRINISKRDLSRMRDEAEQGNGCINHRRALNMLSCAVLSGQEIASSIAAHTELGHTRTRCSHQSINLNPRSHINRQPREACVSEATQPQVAPFSDATVAVAVADASCLEEVENADNDQVRDDDDDANITITKDGWKHTTLHELYLHRGPELEKCSFLTFHCNFRLERRSKANADVRNEEYLFLPTHTMYATHCMKVRTFALIPALSGGVPPRLPRFEAQVSGNSNGQCSAQERLWTSYWSYLVIPWRTENEWRQRTYPQVRGQIMSWMRGDSDVTFATMTEEQRVYAHLNYVLAHFVVRCTRGVGVSRHFRNALNALRLSNATLLTDLILPSDSQWERDARAAHDSAEDFQIIYGQPAQSSIEHYLGAMSANRSHTHSKADFGIGHNNLAYNSDTLKVLASSRARRQPRADQQTPSDDPPPNANSGQTRRTPASFEPLNKIHSLLREKIEDHYLSDEQLRAADRVTSTIFFVREDALPNETPRLFWLEGGAGCGKTRTTRHIIHAISSVYGHQSTAACAYQGLTACNFSGGKTIHNLIKLNPADPGRHTDDEWVASFSGSAEQLKALVLLVIDEISMVDFTMLSRVDRRMRVARDKPADFFGGCVVLCLGDFYQIEPVAGASIIKSYFTNKNCTALWGSVIRLPLKENHRSGEDLRLDTMVSEIRKTKKISSEELRANIAEFTAKDLDEEDMVSLHATNDARYAAGFHFLQAHHARTGNVVIRWRAPFASPMGSDLMQERLYEQIPQLTFYFSKDAKMVLTNNFCTELGLCNGTSGFFHELVFNGAAARVVSSLRPTAGILTLPLDLQPIAIIVAVDILDAVKRTEGREDSPLSPVENTNWEIAIHNNRPHLLIPVPRSKLKVTIPPAIISNKAAIQVRGTKIEYYGFHCTQGYSFTFHRVQGKTLSKVAIDLAPGAGRIPWESLYVALTRARTIGDLRLLMPHDCDLARIDRLSPSGFNSQYFAEEAWLAGEGYLKRVGIDSDKKCRQKGHTSTALNSQDYSFLPSRVCLKRDYYRSTHLTA